MSDFCIAQLSESEKESLRELENNFKSTTGKDFVLIAWEKE